MAGKILAKLMVPLFLLASLPGFAQFNTRPDNSTGVSPNYIPEGTRFMAKLDDTLDTKKLKPGKKFNLKLSEDLTAPNGQTIPAGKKIKAHVSDIDRGMHGRILISFDEIETRHGWRPLVASVSDVPGEKIVKTNEEGEIVKKGRDTRRMVETAAVGAAVGAAAGAVAGGGKGAGIGAGAGAAAGLGAGLLLDRDLKLNKGSQMELRLDRPLQVPQS